MSLSRAFVLAVVLSSAAAGPALAGQEARAPAMHPDRYLTCVLGRSTNIDPSKLQAVKDIIAEGRHELTLRLPPVPVRVGEPPDPTDAPEPVDARTQIIADPDGLTAGANARFARVVDLWPDRVELLSAIEGSTWNQFIAINAISAVTGSAHLFLARVKDAATMDLEKIYQGPCTVSRTPVQMSAR